MTTEYLIVHVPTNAPNLPESLGSKEKFWFDLGGKKALFKRARPGTGEDWAEKVACELCRLLGLPHAIYELATWRGRRGVVSESFVEKDEALIHGNELLQATDRGYPHEVLRPREYRLRIVLKRIEAFGKIPDDSPLVTGGLRTWADLFAGYLLFDAWIGNQDRHHENWGGIFRSATEFRLAPTFDHASSLGRNESDEVRAKRLATKDEGYSVKAYANRAMTPFFQAGTQQCWKTVDAFRFAEAQNPVGARIWLKRLGRIGYEEMEGVFRAIPAPLISEEGIQFALKLLEINQRRLMEVIE